MVDDFQQFAGLIDEFAATNPGFRLYALGGSSRPNRDEQEPGLDWLPHATVVHEETDRKVEDWGDTFPQAIASALANLKNILEDESS